MQDEKAAWLDMWSRWGDMQAGIFRDWMDAWVRMTGAGAGGEEKAGDRSWPEARAFYGRWQEYLQEMMGKFVPSTQGIGPETFMKAFQAADVYSHLYAMWMEVFDAYRSAVGEGGEYDGEAVGKALEKLSEDYRNIVQKVFAPALPEQLQWVAELYDGEIPLQAAGLIVRMVSPWYEYTRRMAESSVRMDKTSPEAAAEIYEGWRKAYEESFGRLLRAPAMGYYREAAEKLRNTLDSITEFNIVLSEFYAALQAAGAKSFEKLQEKLASMQAGEQSEPISFRELYRLWWETSEQLYIELFRTEEFSKLQGQLVDKGMQFRRDFQAFVEEATKELPFPNRTEMDHLYKTVDRLKREVRSLRKEMGELKKAGGEV